MSPGYDDDGEREHDCCFVCGSGSCPGSGSGGDDACTYGRNRAAVKAENLLGLRVSPAPPLSPREREIVDRFEAAPDALDEECGDSHTREWGSITRTYVCDLPAWHRGPHNDFARLYQWGGA